MAMYEAADRGEITADEAYLLVGILLSAAADTTVMTMANAIRAFSEFPDQFDLVRANPPLAALLEKRGKLQERYDALLREHPPR